MKKTLAKANAAALVSIDHDDLWTTSLIVHEQFGKRHKNVLQAIDRLECSEEFRRLNFQPTLALVPMPNGGFREERIYRMTRDGFMFLVMGFTGKPAASVKEYFIAAFNAMERELRRIKVQGQNEEWRLSRSRGKLVRKELTDEIQEFVKYAMGQGSTSAERYYVNVTKMVYKALGIVDQVEPIRDTIDAIGVHNVAVAESVARLAIKEGVSAGMPYKEVYKHAKSRVLEFAALIGAQSLGGGTGRLSVARTGSSPAEAN